MPTKGKATAKAGEPKVILIVTCQGNETDVTLSEELTVNQLHDLHHCVQFTILHRIHRKRIEEAAELAKILPPLFGKATDPSKN